MSKPKKTFTDPETGEEIESTALARWAVRLAFGLFWGLVFGLPFIRGGLLYMLVRGLYFGLFFGLAADLNKVRNSALFNLLFRWVHDGIARWQHQRRQQVRQQRRLRAERLLQRKRLEAEWAGVPDGAISRSRPPGDPEPTAASLSLAELPEETTPAWRRAWTRRPRRKNRPPCPSTDEKSQRMGYQSADRLARTCSRKVVYHGRMTRRSIYRLKRS